MEPSRNSDECSSSESGWTTYLASPMHDEDEEYQNEDDHIGSHKQPNNEEDEEESDDSMASDASSGPSHVDVEVSYGRSKKSNFFGQNSSKLFSGQKNSKQTDKGSKFGGEKEVTRTNANAPTCYSKTAAKVRKNKKTGKK